MAWQDVELCDCFLEYGEATAEMLLLLTFVALGTVLIWLGLTVIDAAALRAILLDVVQSHEAHLGYRDAYGQRYTVDFWLDWHGKRAQVRSGWLLEHGSMTPRLTSCYVL